jgi:succinate dehydrogenase / fumarate reductase, iron-sulfur subunit
MGEISFYIKRKSTSKNSEQKEKLEKFTIFITSGESTVLEALQAVQENIDDSLAIRYGCRFKQCGLCAVTVNGSPRMGCMTKIKDGMVVGALENLPVQQDLVVERQFITEMIKNKKLIPQNLNHSKDPITTREFDILSKCTDCQSCMSACPEYSYENMDSFTGPLFFVKLAQLQNHPQNEHNYTDKAQQLGIAKCEGCTGCPCPYGIPIKKLAINPFLNILNTK